MSFYQQSAASKRWSHLVTASLAIGMWEVLTLIVGKAYFPHLGPVLLDFGVLVTQYSFWVSLLQTVLILTAGLALGFFCAIGAGILLSMNKFVGNSFNPTLVFIRCIPAVTLLPVFIASLGARTVTVIALTTFVVATKLIIYVSRGFHHTHQEIVDYARSARLPLVKRAVTIYLPGSISNIATGLRITAIIAYGTVITCGIAAGTPGIGSSLLLAEEAAGHERIFSYVIVMGVTGIMISRCFDYLQKRANQRLHIAV